MCAAQGFGGRGKPRRHAIAVNGPWRITFEWADGEASAVDLEQYH
ncbi:MAG: plasmid maintenance system killer protein [Alphaproteobacteria bacterium]|nr:plasmid maintenance system killer protein [Alphaproteobacteria bacterium]